MSDTDDLLALQQAVLSVQDMRGAACAGTPGPDERDQIATTEVRQEGFYWVVLGQNPPENAAGGRPIGLPSVISCNTTGISAPVPGYERE
jgi:hypothetical protein